MSPDDAKKLLLRYRPGSTDSDDPEVSEALALAEKDHELSVWFRAHCAFQDSVRAKFRQITPPSGLKEQIISETAARRRMTPSWRVVLSTAAAAIVLVFGLALLWQQRPDQSDLALYRARMVRTALTSYRMDLETNDITHIRAYLAQEHAPSDYTLPVGLRNTLIAGCAVESWQGVKVTMVCFRTGKPLGPGEKSDLWLFVIDKNSLANASISTAPQLAQIKRLMTATWTDGNNICLLAVAEDAQTVRSYF